MPVLQSLWTQPQEGVSPVRGWQPWQKWQSLHVLAGHLLLDVAGTSKKELGAVATVTLIRPLLSSDQPSEFSVLTAVSSLRVSLSAAHFKLYVCLIQRQTSLPLVPCSDARNDQGWTEARARSQEPGPKSRSTMWLVGTQLLQPSLLPPRSAVAGSLCQEPSTEPRQSDGRQVHLSHWCKRVLPAGGILAD